MTVRLVSSLPKSQRSAIEELLFFNPQQGLMRGRIVDSIHRYGMPEIVDCGAVLRLGLSGRGDAQSLFAVLDGIVPVPVGGLLYLRDPPDRFVVAHLFVHEDYSAAGPRSDALVIVRLIAALRGAAAVTAGVRYVELNYADRSAGRVKVTKLVHGGR